MQLTKKGQVTIPKKVRNQLGLKPGMHVDFIEDKQGVRLVKSETKKNVLDRVYGMLQQKGHTNRLIELLRGK